MTVVASVQRDHQTAPGSHARGFVGAESLSSKWVKDSDPYDGPEMCRSDRFVIDLVTGRWRVSFSNIAVLFPGVPWARRCLSLAKSLLLARCFSYRHFVSSRSRASSSNTT